MLISPSYHFAVHQEVKGGKGRRKRVARIMICSGSLESTSSLPCHVSYPWSRTDERAKRPSRCWPSAGVGEA